MNKLSQTEPPLASNPANGINNIPLNGEEVEGVTKDEMRQLMNKVKSASNNFREISDEVTLIADKVQDTSLRHQLYKLSKADWRIFEGPQPKRPSTGLMPLGITMLMGKF